MLALDYVLSVEKEFDSFYNPHLLHSYNAGLSLMKKKIYLDNFSYSIHFIDYSPLSCGIIFQNIKNRTTK